MTDVIFDKLSQIAQNEFGVTIIKDDNSNYRRAVLEILLDMESEQNNEIYKKYNKSLNQQE